MGYFDKPQSLGAVLEAWINARGWRQKIEEAETIEAWHDIAGPQINEMTQGVWIEKKILYVRITSAPWRHELHLSRRAWYARLCEQLERIPIVDEIMFR
jgi:predicted nucleic acid-binding Zn ribbon protein